MSQACQELIPTSLQMNEIAGSCLDEALASVAQAAGPSSTEQRVDIKKEDVRRSLGRLVLVIVRLLHELMERQAIARMEGGSLSDPQIDELGTTLMLQAKEIERLREEFGLAPSDLNLDLGPLGRLL